MIHSRRRLLWLLVLVVPVGLIAAGCRRSPTVGGGSGAAYNPEEDPLVNPASLFEPAPSDPVQIAWDETLFLHLDGNPNTLNPIFFSSMVESIVNGVLFDGPFTFDKEMQWRVNDEFVESFEESEDHTTFTLRLKPGLKWQDGHPLTAHDIVFSWQQILDERVPAQAVRTGTDEITECVALDDLTVRYVQPEPLATSRWNLLFPIIPKHLFEKGKERFPDLRTGEYYNRLNRHPVGSGPYRIVEWRENDRIVLERWEDFHGERPRFRRIVFRIIPDNNVTLLSFTKEDVDVVARLSAQQFALETNDTTFQRVGYKAWGVDWGFSYIGWNMDGSNPFFNDVRVRHAMTHALNIPLILERVMYGLSTQCHGIYHPESWMFNPEVELLEYDLEKSAALLDKAGWRVNPQDGWRYKEIDGRQVRFDFTLLIPQGSPTSPRVAAIFQQDLRRLGINLRTRELEWATFLEQTQSHNFQAQIAAWGTGTDPDTGWNLWRTEEYHTGRNYGGYSNARVDELFALGRREFDFEARRKIYQEIHKLIYDDQPYIFIANSAILAAFNQRIHGVQLSPRGVYGFDPGLQGWWVRSGEARYATARP